MSSAITLGVIGAGVSAYGATQTPEASKSTGTSMGESTSVTKSSVNLMDKLSKQQLDALTGGLSDTVKNKTAFDRQGSIDSAGGVVKSIFDAYEKTALPQIADMGNRGGSYDSTAHQLMANDAYASAVTKASQTVLDTVQKDQQFKEAQDQFNVQALMQALGLQAEVTQQSKSKTKTNQSGSTSGTATAAPMNLGTAVGGAMTNIGTISAATSN